MFVDEEIMQVAIKLGCFWQRRDLTHFHRHFLRASEAIDSMPILREIPEFLREANSPAHWNKFKALYERRKAAGFPGHEVLSEVAA